MLRASALLSLTFVLVAATQPAPAATILVRQDGTGDYTSIAPAIAAAIGGDEVVVGAGTYTEPFVDILVPLTLRSEAGASATIIDGQNANRLYRVLSASTIRGFTFRNGNGQAIIQGGGALILATPGVINVQDCVFQSNVGQFGGGAVYVTRLAPLLITTVNITRCTFVSNTGEWGGAVLVVQNAIANIDQSTFANNHAFIWGGAVAAGEGTTANIATSLFESNSSGDVAGAVYHYRASGLIQSNTFWNNDSPGSISGTLLIQQSPSVNVTQNIIADDQSGYGLRYYQGTSSHSCNVFWGNASGAVGGEALSSTEIVADPIFCGPTSGDFYISANSPAAPTASLCGVLVGAFPRGAVPLPSKPLHGVISRTDSAMGHSSAARQ